MPRVFNRLWRRRPGARRGSLRHQIGRPAPWLLIGPALDRDDYSRLVEQAGVTAIADLRDEALDDPVLMERLGVRWRRFPVRDRDAPTQLLVLELLRWFRSEEPPRGAPAVLYLHCEAGLQRTPTVATALLIAQQQLSLREALHLVRVARPGVDFTDAQRAWLTEFWAGRRPDVGLMR